jgi:hypothetical protein
MDIEGDDTQKVDGIRPGLFLGALLFAPVLVLLFFRAITRGLSDGVSSANIWRRLLSIAFATMFYGSILMFLWLRAESHYFGWSDAIVCFLIAPGLSKTVMRCLIHDPRSTETATPRQLPSNGAMLLPQDFLSQRSTDRIHVAARELTPPSS